MMDLTVLKNAKIDVNISDAILEEDFYSSSTHSERSIMKSSSKKNRHQKVVEKGGADEDHVV